MPTEYDFTQNISSINLLTSLINQANLSTPLQSITTNGTGSFMTVAVTFSDVLSSNDQNTLNQIIANYPATLAGLLPNMISSISTAMQTQANVLTVLQAKVIAAVPTLTYDQLQSIMTLLGLS